MVMITKMVMKLMRNFSKIIFLIGLNAIFSFALVAADSTSSKGRVIRKFDRNGQVVVSESNFSKFEDSLSEPEKEGKASDKYLSPEKLELQRKEEEEKNKALREKNEIGILYSDEYRAQNNDDANQFEEEILKSQINDTGVFLGEDKDRVLSKKDERKRLKVVQEGILAEYKNNIDKKDKKILNLKNPIFFLSEGTNTFSYTNTMDLCSLVNLGNSKLDCLVYPEENANSMASTIRRGQYADAYDKTGVSADFIVVRDDVYSQYKKGRGHIALAPDLDVMMYLNGDYLFMFSNSMANTFSFEYLSAQKQGKVIRVGYMNQQSRVIFERTLAKLFPNHLYKYQSINISTLDRSRDSICNPTNIDVFIYFGGKMPDNLEKAIDDCSPVLNPITLSDSTLSEVVKLTDFFSVANIVNYYPAPAVINYLEIYVALENSYRNSVNSGKISEEKKINLNDYASKDKAKSSKSKSKAQKKISPREREMEAKRKRAEMLKKQRAEERTKKINELKALREEKKRKKEELLAKKLKKKQQKEKESKERSSKVTDFFSFLNFSSKSNLVEGKMQEPVYLNKELIIKEDSLSKIKGKANSNTLLVSNAFSKGNQLIEAGNENESKAYITANTAVKTFGIRYVLLASRYAKRENVINIFDSIIKDFFLVRGSVLTPDVAKFNISDMILGTSGTPRVNNYHPALSKYPNYLLELKSRKTPEQTLALKILNANSTNVVYPSYYGPAGLTTEQMDALYTKARELNKRKDELAAIRIYQRDTINIDKALEEMRKGKQSSDSLLKATGLDYVNVIIDEQSVLSQGMATEEKLTPEAMRELDKLIDPQTIPVKPVSADDVQKAVESTEGSASTPSTEEVVGDSKKEEDKNTTTEAKK